MVYVDSCCQSDRESLLKAAAARLQPVLAANYCHQPHFSKRHQTAQSTLHFYKRKHWNASLFGSISHTMQFY